ncbi:DUF1894 domain-containing protein [Methanogenium sp. S4BF]|uniref:DUF1894 domain-containing protein n=1 Tax=Methanogenium sp. S4BF TaxID=1789226 RepID=UPI0024167667|nr:DUF1894 domain-containing protein [Methanogenium sp. S4BF]WFN35446.1 DUF1894 domain-containing protein [Methanogenium sp. S4BF]
MGCIEQLNYEIIDKHISFKEAADYITKNCPEIYEVNPGFKLFDKAIIGIPPVRIGIDGDIITFPFTKPCHGTFLLRVSDAAEADLVRRKAKNIKY